MLIVEVLSPSTERIDKFEKLIAYRSLESLQEYLLVQQDVREIQLFRRRTAWTREVCREGDVRLESVNVTLSIEAIYRNAGA